MMAGKRVVLLSQPREGQASRECVLVTALARLLTTQAAQAKETTQAPFKRSKEYVSMYVHSAAQR